MKTYKNLYRQLCSWNNLYDAYQKAKKRKSNSIAVKKFDENWRLHLCLLIKELRTQTYQPKALQKFVLRDPKTRVICVSNFRDRVVHHALVNILQGWKRYAINGNSYRLRQRLAVEAEKRLADNGYCR